VSTGEGFGETFPELRACVRDNFVAISVPMYHQRVYIDRKRLRHQRQWVFLTLGETIDFPDNNLWAAEPGPASR
jgi:hypothetical protein